MLIKFRYHRGGLKESLATMRTFTSWEQLYAFLESDSQAFGDVMVRKSWIFLNNDFHHDRRIGWKDCRSVYVRCFAGVALDTPVCIGYVATELCEPTDLSWQN